jgi:hypothetical protein
VIKKHEWCDFLRICRKNPREAALLGYCGLGSAVKVSAILFNDDKNLELLRGLALAMPGIQQCLPSFPKMKKQTKKYCTAISATNLAASILHRNAPRGCPHPEGLTRILQ